MNINTVLDLACADDQIIKKYFSIVLQRTVLELRGISCLELESVPPPKQQIISSRSFPKHVTSRDELNDALLYHLQDAFKRLRDDKSLCGCITTFANSNYFDKNTSYYSKSSSYVFPTPTDNLLELSKAAARLTDSIYQSGVNFKKCGVGLTFLESKTTHNYDLLTDPEDIKRNESLMSSIEEVHSKFGKKTLALGASQMNQVSQDELQSIALLKSQLSSQESKDAFDQKARLLLKDRILTAEEKNELALYSDKLVAQERIESEVLSSIPTPKAFLSDKTSE
ncbi:uncharacterized protein LOC114357255 [Ostrinia furnacalis]|uniref:uncharacterized protein LOC114357255 n=1 Tax=Ostrinia furnacalis TaxID=93504 RepID=UPI00103EF7F7|nr:uncharacterized protein LOC114357255 [Ostrinia furnacalis]